MDYLMTDCFWQSVPPGIYVSDNKNDLLPGDRMTQLQLLAFCVTRLV
jgi:hypothetical protein